MIASRPWLALVLALFCLPLFVGLGRTDVGHDEAIYTFAVDRILEVGDWLTPKASPHEDEAFLEKPPLKFWIVAAPIRFGLLPHNEFGVRFWDALFGGVAFIYIFLIGVRLAGPVCGAVALLVLFVHRPLLFEHGLRSNNMEAALFLSYCGGIYHFLEWARRNITPDLPPSRPWRFGASGRSSLSEPASVGLTARGESPPAFGGRCIPRGCVAPPSNTPGILGRRALPGGRIARLGATPDFHHGLLRVGPTRGAWGHPVAVGVYFVLGFMTKFVAAIFLPMIIGVAALVFRAPRTRLSREWRVWTGVSALCAVLVVPWFVYANIRFGAYFWEVILAQHVYTRFRTFLNPVHVQPWFYYPTEMFLRFGDSGSQWLAVIGLALLVVQSIRRRWLEGTAVVLWFALPVTLISFGASKLYHYAYPFLPPLALAAGYLAALIVMLAPVPLEKALGAVHDFAIARIRSLETLSPAVRAVLLTIAAAAAIVLTVSVLYGPIRLSLGNTMLFKSSGVMRPSTVLLLFGTLAGAGRRAVRIVVALLVMGQLPLQAYRDLLPRLTIEQHPMRSATDCLTRAQAELGPEAKGLYLDVPEEFISHPLYYYFRRVRPWIRAPTSDPAAIGRLLADPAQSKPMLVWDSTYRNFMNAQSSRPASPPMVALPDVLLLLPGPYASCSAAVPSHGSR
jgi:4-amino-4-deoxy-L-arabinose transferase-like glycosyltransferase